MKNCSNSLVTVISKLLSHVSLLCAIQAGAGLIGQVVADDLPLGLRPVPIPKDNPQTVEKIALGKQLYFDKRLSKDNTVSLAHH